ncbi:RsiW-degrading membrane proteinase PrsW (M82 family) [Alkalihalobacillus xiaoxiensis]|uniref:RsiW-degrading membrane proteinase PrsW (M82 family) n=1 Tax=Shouchella xiaoxiensis TaxID=766895 RepID=A0ABS2SQP2_9BACI|nr:DUF5367 domain-containing protein [Shouchella xiaoxiensis]MBM7837823.1 RsiW-degrading membrane proteinase PrsW (M82 family) [Shouchella xiaoxiensis]
MFFLIWGFLVWLGATAIFRFSGHLFFSNENLFTLGASYLLVIPLVLAITLPLYYFKNVTGEKRLKAAVFIALPGMILDVLVLLYFSQIFVNLSAEMDQYFASWLLLAYSTILITGIFSKQKKK